MLAALLGKDQPPLPLHLPCALPIAKGDTPNKPEGKGGTETNAPRPHSTEGPARSRRGVSKGLMLRARVPPLGNTGRGAVSGARRGRRCTSLAANSSARPRLLPLPAPPEEGGVKGCGG